MDNAASGNQFRKTAADTLTVIAVIALALLIWKLSSVLLLVFSGILISIFFSSLAYWITKWTRLSSRWSLVLVLFTLLAIFSAGIYFSGGPIAGQMTELVEQIPRSIEKILDEMKRYAWGEWLIKRAPQSAKEIPISGEDVTSFASGAFSSLTGAIAAAFIALFVAIYLSFDPMTYTRGAIRLFPVNRRDRVLSVIKEVHETLQMWLLGGILSMILVGVLTTVGLWLIGVPLAFALGVIAALLTFVPNFGPILSVIPAVLLAFVESPMMALYVIILYFAIQMVESYLVTPLIQQKTVSLPPALTISAQVGLGLLFGAGGFILATPLTAGALVLFHRLYVEDALEAGIESDYCLNCIDRKDQ